MGKNKLFENFNSLNIIYSLYDLRDSSDEPIILTYNFSEIIMKLKELKEYNGLNWSSGLLIAIEKKNGILRRDTVMSFYVSSIDFEF